jgi:hypothetical protein
MLNCISDPEAAGVKPICDLIRVAALEPMEARLLATLPLRMRLVPAMLSLTVTYVIVILQINKVV